MKKLARRTLVRGLTLRKSWLLGATLAVLALPRPSASQDLTRVLGVDPAITTGSSRAVNWVDTDGDGDLDLYVTSGGTQFENNEYYRNDGGSFFRDVSAAVALDSLRADGSTWGDYDNDGDPDLFVVSWYGENNGLFENLGGGAFSRVTTGPAVTTGTYSEGCSWVDYDADGLLDLYVTNSGTGASLRNNLLYRNDGATLVEVTTGPLVGDTTISRQGSWADYDDDGDVDVFIVNESGQNNRLLRNLLVETGTADFEEVDAGVLTSDGGDSFSASWGDFDNDGDFDVIVANFAGTQNFFYRNELTETGTATFARILDQDPGTNNGWSIGTHWADWDNDADLDLMITNGFANIPSVLRRNFYYRNDGGTLVRDQTTAASSDSGWAYAAAWGDSDGDGDLDLCIANWMGDGQENGYYLNGASTNGNHWLTFDCVGVASNRSGIGCKVTATATVGGDVVTQVRNIAGSDGYCSQTLRGHFGLGDATVVDVLTVRWPNGAEQVLTNVPVDAHLQIVEDVSVGVPSLHGSLDRFRIERIAPNPFRASTSIRYAIASDERVRLSIVDAAGRRVRRIDEGTRAPGTYDAAWDGRDDKGALVASGVYFVELATSTDRSTRRVLLLR